MNIVLIPNYEPDFGQWQIKLQLTVREYVIGLHKKTLIGKVLEENQDKNVPIAIDRELEKPQSIISIIYTLPYEGVVALQENKQALLELRDMETERKKDEHNKTTPE